MTFVVEDLRDVRGPIEVRDEHERLHAYAVPASASPKWAVWTHGGNGPRDWSHTIVADSDAALAALTEWVERTEPAVRAGDTLPQSPARAVAQNVAGYAVLIGGLLGLVQLGGWAMSLVGAP